MYYNYTRGIFTAQKLSTLIAHPTRIACLQRALFEDHTCSYSSILHPIHLFLFLLCLFPFGSQSATDHSLLSPSRKYSPLLSIMSLAASFAVVCHSPMFSFRLALCQKWSCASWLSSCTHTITLYSLKQNSAFPLISCHQ